MPPPTVVDLDSSSDVRFRDVYGRHQYQAVPRSGNLIQKIYHHVSGDSVNVSAMEVVSLDASENAQFDLLLRKSSAPITSANVTNGNIATWSADALLSLRQGTTAIRSANVTVGNLSVGADCTAKLDNCIVRSFQKTLGTTAGTTADICTIDAITGGSYTVELNVIQSESVQRLARVFKFNVRYHATNGEWRRLVPVNQVLDAGNFRWLVEIRVSFDTASLRLYRLGGTGVNFECVLTVYQSRATPIVITPSDATATGVTQASFQYSETLVTQLNGRAAFANDPGVSGYALTVGSGGLLVTGTTTTANVHDIEIRGTVSGSGVTDVVSQNSTALITSGGVHSYFNTGTYTTGSVTVDDKTTTTTSSITGGVAHNSVLPQGCYVNWNTTPGQGRVEIVNKYGLGLGGFYFYEHAGGDTATPIDDTTRILHFDRNGMVVQRNVLCANAQSVFSSTAGSKFHYRQLAQPCVWRGSWVINATNAPFTSFTANLGTDGPYTSDTTTCVVRVSNGDYAANATYFPLSACVEEFVSGQIRKIRILFTCDNTNLCRTNVAIYFTPP
jgi:hypothetical protein